MDGEINFTKLKLLAKNILVKRTAICAFVVVFRQKIWAKVNEKPTL